MRQVARRHAAGLGLAFALSLAAPAARAEDAPPAGRPTAQVPRASDLVLDGRLDEAAWAGALALPADPLDVPPAPPGVEKVRLVPEVRVLESGGALWLGVALAEDPGLGIGLRVMAGPDALGSAAQAVSIGFAPHELRAARLSVRGPRGATRAGGYPVEGACDAARRGAWSLELRVPIAALELGGAGAVLRTALAVTSRSPNLVAGVPVGGLFSPPAAWLRLVPAAGAWSTGAAPTPAEVEGWAAQDARDEQRLEAWRAFLKASQGGPEPDAGGNVSPEGYRRALLEPLERIAALRPDLAPWTAWVRGDVLQRFGDPAGARAAYDAALAALPGCREAAFQRDVRLAGQAAAEGGPGDPSDYAAALARVAPEGDPADRPYVAEGRALARGLLHLKRGDFAQAVAALEPLARRYPADPLITLQLERARELVTEASREEQRRQAQARRGDLPRLLLTTTAGPIELELHEDDAPNAVKSVVWLVDHGFYDGLAFHRNVPFFGLQGGDPFSRAGADAARVGGGGPGYATAIERSPRPLLRGCLCLLGSGPDAEGSQLLLTTGTAVHLKDAVSVVGHVVAGQEAADRLVAGDRIEKAVVTRRRPATTYRPVTVGGEPAPEPVPAGLAR